MKSEQLIEKLNKYNKSYYTVADIQKIVVQPRAAVLVMLNRLVKSGKIIRLRKNIYLPKDTLVNYELIAQQLESRSYLSFESALARFGILSQIPYAITLATVNRSKKIFLGEQEIVYRKIDKKLFFNYVDENGIRIATPEKALLDMAYLYARGKVSLNINELNSEGINFRKLKALLKKFPKYVKNLVEVDAERGVVKILKKNKYLLHRTC